MHGENQPGWLIFGQERKHTLQTQLLLEQVSHVQVIN